ncbi:MAG: ABC-three component system middle component 6 [Brevinema sp.]
MILEDRINPEYSLYYQAYVFLTLVKKHNRQRADFLSFFDFYTRYYSGKKISLSKFVLLMDFLYINGKATVVENGELHICL